MGKQKDFHRHVHHVSHNKKKDKKTDKTSKQSRSSFPDGYLKNFEVFVQPELEAAVTAKKISRKMQKELERYPLLAKAVFLGCERVVDGILETCPDVNMQIWDGSTPLIIAVENGYPDIVQKLLKKGADPKILRQDGRNALMIAVSKNDNRSFTLILNYWDKSNFCELNHSDSQGYTVLTIAAECGHSHFAKFLLGMNGIEIDKQTKDGKTALMFAIAGHQDDIVQKLIDSGSDFTLEDQHGSTAMCLAIAQNQTELKNSFFDCLDSKGRDLYVKKRIELLCHPRIEGSLSLIPFYKDTLFRVILEIKRSFEDGAILLERYKVFFSLLKCIDKYQEDTELLRVCFHLAVCLMYDKAEYSRYVVEELAEQYINSKFADFAMKVMQNIRLRTVTDLRGAAFLGIHAGTQCRSGKIWLKSKCHQILPFVKEFKAILPALTFWADGENVKSRVMFDRFVENLNIIENDLKAKSTPKIEPKKVVSESNICLEKPVKASTTSISALSIISLGSDTQPNENDWRLVSNSKSGCKNLRNIARRHPSLSNRTESKKQSKKGKVQNKLRPKIASKKLAQRPNLKYVPGLEGSFPTVPSEKKFAKTGYADALKRNLRDEALMSEISESETSASKDTEDLSSISDIWPTLSSCNMADKKDDRETDKEQLIPPEYSDTRNDADSNVNESKKSADYKEEKKEFFYDLWNNSISSGDPPNLMTFIINHFNHNESSEKKEEKCNKEGQYETYSSLPPIRSSTPIQTKGSPQPLWDFFEKMRTQTCSKDGIENDLINKPKYKVEKKSKSSANIENKNTESEALQYAGRNGGTNSEVRKRDCALGNTADDVIATTEEPVTLDDNSVDDSLKKEPVFDEDGITVRKDGEVRSSSKMLDKSHSSTDCTTLSDSICSQTSSEKGSFLSSSDNYSERCINNNFARSVKRKYRDARFQELLFNTCREEIIEVNRQSFAQSDKYYENSRTLLVTLFPCLNTAESTNYTLAKNKDEVNMNKFTLKYDDCSNCASSLKISCSERLRNLSASNLQKIPDTVQSTLYDSFKRYNRNRFGTEVKEVPLYETEETVKTPDSINSTISRVFESFHLNTDNQKQNRRSLISYDLSDRATHFLPMINVNDLRKVLLVYQRLILYESTNQFRTPILYTKTQPDKFMSNSIDSKSCFAEDNALQKSQLYSQKNEKMKIAGNSLVTNKEYSTVVKFKTEVNKFMSASLLQTKKLWKQSKPVTKEGIRQSKIAAKKVKRAASLKQKVAKDDDKDCVKFMFSTTTHGYKPEFINCEQRSGWYEILWRIESCVPLASFSWGFIRPEKNISDDSKLHELVFSSGKIVYSSKEEHVLRSGEYGSYIGLMSNGNPVVVRQFENSSNKIVELFRRRRVSHKNIATFYCLCTSPRDQKVLAVTELIEYSLPEYLKEKLIYFNAKLLVQELIEAVRYLHRRRIVHGFLKPSNVMVTIDHRLKVTGFYQLDVVPLVYGVVRKQNKSPTVIGSSLSSFCWRPYEVIAADSADEARKYLTTASDIQMTGMLIYFILSAGKHPFGSSDASCQENIWSGIPEFGPRPSDIESRDLVQSMIKKAPSSRLTIKLVAKHPFLWNFEHRFKFLVAVSRKIEFFTRKPTKVGETLQDSCLEARDWTCYIHSKLLKYISKCANKTYVNNYVDLLHFAVSVNDNFEFMPPELKSFIGQPSFFIIMTFPTIFMCVYCVMRDNPCAVQQMSLQSFF